MTNWVIETENLTKIYQGDFWKKGQPSLENLNLQVREGEVYAFIGPNGAGKTTTIKILTRLLFPTKGKIRILGHENFTPSALRQVGYMPEQPSFYGYLTGREFLRFIGRIFGISKTDREKRISELLIQVGLKGKEDLLIRKYSRGMMQRLGLAQSLINDPALLILDEPMASLDPIGRKEFRDLILDLKERKKSIFFSSHILNDAEMVADRIGILHQGKQIRVGKLEELVESQDTEFEVTFTMQKEMLKKMDLQSWHPVVHLDQVLIRLKKQDHIPNLLSKIVSLGGDIVSVIPRRKSLESLFMEEVGR